MHYENLRKNDKKKNRIEIGIDKQLAKNQYGFREERSTAHAIHILRRVIDLGERHNEKIHIILLDWEKAFDKVTHEGLHNALERMNIAPKLRNLIKEPHKAPNFYVEMEGNTSRWKTQNSGIRQGCPLSPYLFLIVMTVLFHDVYQNEQLNKDLEKDKILGTIFNEILYADDTIIYSKSAKTLKYFIVTPT